MSAELKKDSLDAIITALADGLSLELLTARATLATGRGLSVRQYTILTDAGFDLNHSACYAEKCPKDVCIDTETYRLADHRIHSMRTKKLRYTVYEEDGSEDGKYICTFESKDELKKVIEKCGWCVVGGEEYLED